MPKPEKEACASNQQAALPSLSHSHPSPLHRQPVLALPLHLVHKVKVALVKLVDADVAVLSAAGIAFARRVAGDRVEGTEVTAHAANLLFKNLVVEARLELALTGRGGGDVHGGLATAEDDEVLLGRHGGGVEGGVGDVGLEDLEVLGRDELEAG